MDTCSLNMLHNTGNEDIFAVAYSINLKLASHNVFINKNWLLCVDFNGRLQIVAKRLLVSDNLHRSAAENERRTNKNRIADAFGNLNALFNIGYGKSFWLRNTEIVHYLFKRISVFCSIDSLNISTDNRNAESIKRRRKVYCGLTAERHNYAERIFKTNNIHYILNSERLKIKLVGGCIVS